MHTYTYSDKKTLYSSTMQLPCKATSNQYVYYIINQDNPILSHAILTSLHYITHSYYCISITPNSKLSMHKDNYQLTVINA